MIDNLRDGMLVVVLLLLILAFLQAPQPEQRWTPRERLYLGDGVSAYSYPALGYRTWQRLDFWLTEEPTTR